MKKRIICLAVFLVLLCRGVSLALAEGGFAAALANDPAWEDYEITAQAGDYAVVSAPDYNALVTVDGDGQIAAYPIAVHQPDEGFGPATLLPLRDGEMTGFQLIYDNPYGENEKSEYYVFDGRVSDNAGDLLLRKAKIGDLRVYRVDDRPEINLKEHIANFAASYGVVYSDERLERCVQHLIQKSESTSFDLWARNAPAIFMVELQMTRSMAITDALLEDTVSDLNAIRWIRSWNDSTNGWDGQPRYIITDGQQIVWYSDHPAPAESFWHADVITLPSFSISLFPDSIAWARDAFSNAQ